MDIKEGETMSNRIYSGPEEAWAVIWQTIGLDMESKAFDPKLREEIRGAYRAIMDATSQEPTDGHSTASTPPVSGLTFQQIRQGKQYRYNIQGGKFATLHGKLCTVEKKGRSRLVTVLDQDWLGHKKGDRLTVYPQHLMPV